MVQDHTVLSGLWTVSACVHQNTAPQKESKKLHSENCELWTGQHSFWTWATLEWG